MTEPSTLLVAGDTHGNAGHVSYLFDRAQEERADAIFQVGDFGYWEHEKRGVEYLDQVSDTAVTTGLPWYWIDGNHENHSLLRTRYAMSEKSVEGFWTIRPSVFYVPRGTRWRWQGRQLMGFGGAISFDREWRLWMESDGGLSESRERLPGPGPGTYWWPEEQATPSEVDYALRDPGTLLDVLFTHDKPRLSNPRWDQEDSEDLWPHQDAVQRLVDVLQPRLLIHGHLHHRYTDRLRPEGRRPTNVEGLSSDKSEPRRFSWMMLELSSL